MKAKTAPPLSIPLLLRLGLRPLSLTPVLKPVILKTINNIQEHHPTLTERLSNFYGSHVRIELSDLEITLLLKIDKTLSITVEENFSTVPAIATVRSDSLSILNLLSGTSDGDALFFSRDLSIEGDTEVILALRNAFDNAQIQIEKEIIPAPKILKPHITKILWKLRCYCKQKSKDLETLRLAFITPLQKRLDQLSEKLHEIDQRMSTLEKKEKNAIKTSFRKPSRFEMDEEQSVLQE